MLLECYNIDSEGEATQVEPEDITVTSDSLMIILNHTTRYVYVFKGKNVSIVQKFSSARTASQMRLQHGYRIKHVEETEGIDADFVPILEFLGGLQGANEQAAAKPSEPKPQPKIETIKTVSKPKPVEKPLPQKETKKPTTPQKVEEIDESKIPEDLPKAVQKAFGAMMSFEPPERSECDYVLVGNKLFLVTGNKKDLRKAEFTLEAVPTLPEGIFPAENYYPRLLIEKKKVLGVEFWARR